MLEDKKSGRKSFIKIAALGSLFAATSPKLAFQKLESGKKLRLQKNDVILFQGDSITDAGRNRSTVEANNSPALGYGYAGLAAANLLSGLAEKNLTIYNKGISGNKVFELQARWEADCIVLKPDVLSILVGVNDFWHTLSHGYAGTAEKYEKDFRQLLTDTRSELPNVKLIICEPFAIKGLTAVTDNWFPEFDTYRMSARKIALDFEAVFIPYHDIFQKALRTAPAAYWSQDGVHPSLAGNGLMAEHWLKVVGN